MNIVKTKDSPSACPFCGIPLAQSAVKACWGNCLRRNPREIFDVPSLGPHGEPHVHVVCNDCKFTFLVEPEDAEGLKKLL